MKLPVLRIRDVYSGSEFFPSRIRSKEFKCFTQKLFLSSRKYDLGCSSQIRILIFYPSRIPDPCVKKAHWKLHKTHFYTKIKFGTGKDYSGGRILPGQFSSGSTTTAAHRIGRCAPSWAVTTTPSSPQRRGTGRRSASSFP
jgi:hypothetical protein